MEEDLSIQIRAIRDEQNRRRQGGRFDAKASGVRALSDRDLVAAEICEMQKMQARLQSHLAKRLDGHHLGVSKGKVVSAYGRPLYAFSPVVDMASGKVLGVVDAKVENVRCDSALPVADPTRAARVARSFDEAERRGMIRCEPRQGDPTEGVACHCPAETRRADSKAEHPVTKARRQYYERMHGLAHLDTIGDDGGLGELSNTPDEDIVMQMARLRHDGPTQAEKDKLAALVRKATPEQVDASYELRRRLRWLSPGSTELVDEQPERNRRLGR